MCKKKEIMSTLLPFTTGNSLCFHCKSFRMIIHSPQELIYQPSHFTPSHWAWLWNLHGNVLTQFWRVPAVQNIIDTFQFYGNMTYLRDSFLTPPIWRLHPLLNSMTLSLKVFFKTSLAILSIFHGPQFHTRLLNTNNFAMFSWAQFNFLHYAVLCSTNSLTFDRRHQLNTLKAYLSVFFTAKRTASPAVLSQ